MTATVTWTKIAPGAVTWGNAKAVPSQQVWALISPTVLGTNVDFVLELREQYPMLLDESQPPLLTLMSSISGGEV